MKHISKGENAFDRKQPDLNWECEELREEIYSMVNFWLEKGIAGFRIDGCSIIMEMCGQKGEKSAYARLNV